VNITNPVSFQIKISQTGHAFKGISFQFYPVIVEVELCEFLTVGE